MSTGILLLRLALGLAALAATPLLLVRARTLRQSSPQVESVPSQRAAA